MAVGDAHLLSPGGDSSTSPDAAPATRSGSRTTKRNKRALVVLLTSILALAAVAAVVAYSVSSSSRRHNNTPSPAAVARSHAIVRSACSSTLYPDLCFTSLTTSTDPSLVASLSDRKSVIERALNLTRAAARQSTATFRALYEDASKANRTARERTALHDCLVMFDETIDEVDKAEQDLRLYPGGGKTLEQHAADLKTLLSAAMSNQESCLDGFSHDDVCRALRRSVQGGCVYIDRLCSNALAMIKNLTDGDIKAERTNARRLLQHSSSEEEEEEHSSSSEPLYPLDEESGFPEWLSAGDRKLLQASSVQADAVVAQDGSGNFRTVSAAVAAAPEKSAKRYVIRIKAGVYRENVDVPKKKTNLMFVGDDRKTTIITGSRNVVDGSTTFNSATVAVVGDRFLARDITFQNTAGPSKHQAVALRVGSDFSAFYRCDILAYQDTLYVHSLRQFYRDCLVQGTVDFIFGNAAAVIQNSALQARRPNSGQKNMFTAQGREDPNQNTGISIQGCTISAASDLAAVQGSFKSYLGRPWKQYSRTVVMKSTITNVIDPAGWHEWSGTFALNTLYYGEYQNTGAGAGTSGRVTWKGYRVITSASEAAQFTPANFISGSSWLAGTGFPFQLGL